MLLKLVYVSLDSHIRVRMSPNQGNFGIISLNKPIEGTVICKVVKSRNMLFRKNKYVVSFLQWIIY